MYRPSHKTAGGIAAWVAAVAVALNALWPLVAQFNPGMADMQMEGCAEAGMEHHAAAGQKSKPAAPASHMPHCGFCTLVPGGFTVAVASSFDAAHLTVDTKESRPSLPEVRPLAFLRHSPAHPRAPPVLS